MSSSRRETQFKCQFGKWATLSIVLGPWDKLPNNPVIFSADIPLYILVLVKKKLQDSMIQSRQQVPDRRAIDSAATNKQSG